MPEYPKLPPIPHVTRNVSVGGQPWPWAVAESSTAESPGEHFRDGVLLGWQGWDPLRTRPTWRYWDGALFGERVWIGQNRNAFAAYEWEGWWFHSDIDFPFLCFQHTLQVPDGNPWGNFPLTYPWIGTVGTFTTDILPNGLNYHWYGSQWAALQEWPDCLRQDNYLETYGVYWG